MAANPLNTLMNATHKASPFHHGAHGARGSRGSRPSTSPFSDILKTADTGTGRTTATTEDTAMESARQLVSSTFIQPILAQAHNDPFKGKLFHGGQGEQAFQQQMDTILADRVTAKANLPIVDAVYQRVMQQSQRLAGPPGATASQPATQDSVTPTTVTHG